MLNKAPWTDFNGNALHEGDEIIHPSGQRGIITYHKDREDETDKWCVKYYEGLVESRLCLQIGDKGRAVVL